MTDTELRLILILLGALILLAVYLVGRKRTPKEALRPPGRRGGERQEPNLGYQPQGDGDPADPVPDHGGGSDTPAWAGSPAVVEPAPREPAAPRPGVRREQHFDRIVTVHVMANDGGSFAGAELVVAAEKASLVHGDRGLFHRLVDGKPELGPLFSMVNRVRPGHFDLSRLAELRTPGVSLFMTLPGPLSALDCWERLLPAAQRLAELLHGTVYDEQMNALGRQRIASIRDELRAWDRKQESREVRARW